MARRRCRRERLTVVEADPIDRNLTLQCDIAVIGGGLSGLLALHELIEAGIDAQLFEALPRPGGRIASVRDQVSGAVIADLGPTWVWPPYQPGVTRWMERLGLRTFPQYEAGEAILDLHPYSPPLRQFLPGQHGMMRVEGGPQAFVDALLSRLPPQSIHLDSPVKGLSHNGDHLVIFSRDREIHARKVILAVPLRVAAQTIALDGLVDDRVLTLMRNTPTWMAAQAKVAILYETPFWREAGLGGRVASRVGPMVEVHDNSPANGSVGALFGFVGWGAQDRRDLDLKVEIRRQLIRCFGPQAGEFIGMEIRDWAFEETIATAQDQTGEPAHPAALPQFMREPLADGKLHLAISETAADSPGLIDGALEAGERAAKWAMG